MLGLWLRWGWGGTQEELGGHQDGLRLPLRLRPLLLVLLPGHLRCPQILRSGISEQGAWGFRCLCGGCCPHWIPGEAEPCHKPKNVFPSRLLLHEAAGVVLLPSPSSWPVRLETGGFSVPVSSCLPQSHTQPVLLVNDPFLGCQEVTLPEPGHPMSPSQGAHTPLPAPRAPTRTLPATGPPFLCRSQHVEYLMSDERFHLLTQAK